MIPIDIGDPANPNTTYPNPVTLPSNTALLSVLNDSPYQLLLTFTGTGAGGMPRKAPSGVQSDFPCDAGAQQVAWTIDKSLAPSSALISDVTLECYSAGEAVINRVPIVRQQGVGNQIGAIVTSVVQDGQPNGQTIIEATPTGQGQNILITTDGNAQLAGSLKVGTIGYRNQFTFFGTLESGSAGELVFQAWDGSVNQQPFGIGSGAGCPTFIGFAGQVAQVASQATAGSFGVPVIVAQAVNVHVTVTTLHTILSFTPAANGLYRVSAAYTFSNAGASQNLTIALTWADPNAGSPSAEFTDGSIIYNAHAMSAGTVTIALLPITIYAGTGAAIVCEVQDSANTPNDHVSFVIERLA